MEVCALDFDADNRMEAPARRKECSIYISKNSQKSPSMTYGERIEVVDIKRR